MDKDKLRELVAGTLFELINEGWILDVPKAEVADHNGSEGAGNIKDESENVID